MNRKGIILAGGSGSRLWPVTLGVSKQLLPIYDKPMIYYPLSLLMLAGTKEIAVITKAGDQEAFKRLLGDGSQWGIEISYLAQEQPNGIAEAYIIAEKFLDGSPSVLALGDNLFFGNGLQNILHSASEDPAIATIFGYHVKDPKRYGVIGFDQNGNVVSIEEKPENPASNFAITGLYFLGPDAPALASNMKPSARGELEITTLLEKYLADGRLKTRTMGRGIAWLDTGTHASLLEAGNFVKTLTDRQGLLVGSPDEVAIRMGLVSADELKNKILSLGQNDYRDFVNELIQETKGPNL